MIALFGAGVGLGLVVLARSLRPSVPPLGPALDRLSRPGIAVSASVAEVSLRDRIGSLAAAIVGASGDVRRDRDLRVTGRTLERHAYEKVLAATVGVALPLCLAVATGETVPFVVLAVVGGLGGFVFPDVSLRSAAAGRRRVIRHELSAYLDLVAIVLAGGGGIQTALQAAATAGEGQAFTEISAALDRARLTATTAWRALDRLADDVGVDDLREFARTLELAGSQGARIGSSVSARADALRGRLRAEVEAEAEAVTERMLVPVAVMLVGLLLFIGFAVVAALGTSSTVVG